VSTTFEPPDSSARGSFVEYGKQPVRGNQMRYATSLRTIADRIVAPSDGFPNFTAYAAAISAAWIAAVVASLVWNWRQAHRHYTPPIAEALRNEGQQRPYSSAEPLSQ